MTNLPKPSSLALEHSEKLTAHIREIIENAGGQIDFARFMELALYAPGLGYYVTDTHKFGREGDFVTAPEISPLFAQCMAKQFQQVFSSLDQKNILEFGAGSGIFARDVLRELEKLNALPDQYYILEVSGELRERQLQRLKKDCPEWLSRISWLDSLPKKFNGIIFANEVLDAMPVHRFIWNKNTVQECGVACENNQFVWRNMPASFEIKKRVQTIFDECFDEGSLPDFYQSEINFVQSAWIKSLADILEQGMILLVDYGYGRREYYHPERTSGTLTCFYQHHRHTDPLFFPGLQDITAHVDFTMIAESADEAGLVVAGFTTQAAFLLATGLLDYAEKNNLDEVGKYRQSQAIKTLTLPSEMGEVVKVMALSRSQYMELIGFNLSDRRNDL
jgi:SAM-dependent MidA family methyltransferase